MSESVTCNRCYYKGDIDSFHSARSVYTEIRCPECGSTDNKHNQEYQEELHNNMRVLPKSKS